MPRRRRTRGPSSGRGCPRGFRGEVEACAAVLEEVDDAQRLLIVAKALGEQSGQGLFARVAERRVTEVVAEGDGLGEVLVETERAGDRTGDLLHLDGVGHPRDHVVRVGGDEDLRLMLQTAEGTGVDDAIAVALVLEAEGIEGLGARSTLRGGLVGSAGCKERLGVEQSRANRLEEHRG